MSNQHAEYTLTLEHLWQFSLQFYGVREVKEACLSLQNKNGLLNTQNLWVLNVKKW